MNEIAAQLLLVPLALACASPAATAVAVPQDEGQDPAAQEPTLRFGDPLALAYDAPFFPGARYDDVITTPDAILGQRQGSRLAHHAEIIASFRRWAEESPRVTVQRYARTHEGRELIYAVITSPANHARLDEIRADLARLHDPRGLSDAEARRILDGTPPVAWMGYSIHGDELSGADASAAVGYHLAASTDGDVAELLDQIVVVIDPVMNPDGRERIIAMTEQSAGYTPNVDYASMHRGHWPGGRGNHYLFDMNRDWMVGSQPETRGRWQAVLSFHPQLFVDAHEMGSLDTFLTYPQAEPINEHFPATHVQWQKTFAADVARAFDRYGWSYYTREWADGWAPFYSDAWSALIGATGILYEQAGIAGTPLRRASGEILTYREAVHHQATASMANLRTLAARRKERMEDYLATKRYNVAADSPGNDRMLVVRPGRADRVGELVRILAGQEIEVFRADAEFEASAVEDVSGERSESATFPAGSLLVPARQPMKPMVHAYLDFDARMDKDALQKEREDLERKGSSRIYDVTAWALEHALDLDAAWCDAVDVARTPVTELPTPETTIVVPADREGGDAATVSPQVTDHPATAWVVPGDHDSAVAFAARAMELGLQLNAADERFTVGAVELPRGSLIVRRHENEGDAAAIAERVLRAASEAGAPVVYAAGTGRSNDEGPDFGGGHFQLLSRPRVALLSNSPISSGSYGHLWHHLDAVLGVPFTILDAQAFGRADLRRYNVLVIPPGGTSTLLAPHKDALRAWVRGGGTLIGCGSSAAALTKERLGLSSVVLRRNALEDLEPYRTAARREREAREIEIDEALVWGDPVDEADAADAADAAGEVEEGEEGAEEEKESEKSDKVSADDDAWMRTFAPQGVTLRAHVNTDAWLTYGAEGELPVYYGGSNVFLSRPPVRTPVRLAATDELRLGGLVWPEARERLSEGAWLTVERSGRGQVILFAAMPAFRGYHAATARLFANAVVYGPGLGADQPVGW